MRGKPTARVVVEAMRADRAKGATWADLCATYDVALSTAQKYAGDVPPPEGGWSKGGVPATFDHAKARSLRKQGLTIPTLAKRFGVGNGAIEAVLYRRKAA